MKFRICLLKLSDPKAMCFKPKPPDPNPRNLALLSATTPPPPGPGTLGAQPSHTPTQPTRAFWLDSRPPCRINLFRHANILDASQLEPISPPLSSGYGGRFDWRPDARTALPGRGLRGHPPARLLLAHTARVARPADYCRRVRPADPARSAAHGGL